MEKSQLRKEIRKIRDSIPLEDRIENSKKIAERIIMCPQFQEAKEILLFASFGSEVDTKPLFYAAIEHRKKVYFPKVIEQNMVFYQVEKWTELADGYQGIKEPKENEALRFQYEKAEDRKAVLETPPKIFILMPGLVFDRRGNRIGYGGGFYDKYLERLEQQIAKENICKMAAAFSCQIVEEGRIKSEDHDKCPDYIVTENEIISLGGNT